MNKYLTCYMTVHSSAWQDKVHVFFYVETEIHVFISIKSHTVYTHTDQRSMRHDHDLLDVKENNTLGTNVELRV